MQLRLIISKAFLVPALLAALISLQFVPHVARAQAQELPDNTVVTVNGMAITYDDISMAEDELMGLVGQLPERQRFETLVSFMVERLLAANAARQAGLENSEEVEKRVAFLKQKALQDVYVGTLLMERVNEDSVAAYY